MNSLRSFKFAVISLVSIGALVLPSTSSGAVGVSITIAPPLLPVYAQPLCAGPDYLWTPGYWAYGPYGYYWVPGTWVLAPDPGLLWTPGYWAFSGGFYLWHAGFWGPHVGFYGGVDYGFGYPGVGFVGGRWVGGHFSYNTAVMRVNTAIIHNTYVDRTGVNRGGNHVSFNGPGGISARPTTAETAAEHDPHISPTAVQTSHERAAGGNRSNFASVNHGRPAVAAVSRPTAEPNKSATVNRAPARAPAPQAHSEAPQNRPAPERQAAPPARAPAPQAHSEAPQNRPAPERQAAPSARAPQARSEAPQNRPAPVAKAAPPARAQAPENHPAAPERRPEPPARAPQAHSPAPQAHSEAPQNRPAPQAHSEAPQNHPAPQRTPPAASHREDERH